MMRIMILTTIRHGIASRVLPELCANPKLTVVKVVLANGVFQNRKRMLKRKIQKTIRIGLLGALNGIRLRDWYIDKEAEDICMLCDSMNIPMSETEVINCEATRELFREASADIGLSLGNGYITKSVFSIPKYGMLNIHTEILPCYQGAQSILWPIFDGVKETGFTIHQVDSHIDTGEILFLEKYPILFFPTLRETVEKNLMTARGKIPAAFSYVCENYEPLKDKSKTQGTGKSYTTPTFWQFRRMVKKHKLMYQESLAGPSET